MNNRPLVRKIIYLITIGVLVIPLSFIALPETRDADGEIKNAGGMLSRLRDQHDLSQAKLTEVDPASETMKLASLGLRGVAVNILWLQANEHKKNGNYDGLRSTLDALTKIQPNFVKVWEYQAHNLAYNVSMEFDDYESRYNWVKKGLSFFKQGIRYNKQDHRITDGLGFFTGNKFGKSDEKTSFRRMFRSDSDFHESMSDRIDPEGYELREHGHDSWKMAYQWYDYSRDMVENGAARKRRNDVLFYMFRPAQLRNMGLTLQTEFPTDDVIQDGWRGAYEEWTDYGDRELFDSTGVPVLLRGTAKVEDKIAELRDKLDTLVPEGTRRRLKLDVLPNSDLAPEEQEEYKFLSGIDGDQLASDQQRRLRELTQVLGRVFDSIDQRVAMEAELENQIPASKVALEIAAEQKKIRSIGRDSQTVNYGYWESRTKAESENATVLAQQALHEARQVWKQSLYDDEYDFDYRTKKKTVTKKGAISLYLEAFEMWKPIMEGNPRLNTGQLGDRVAKFMVEYQQMLAFSKRDWPKDFPLQKMIDLRDRDGSRDGLPTSATLAEMVE
jgi:hypothetical protein